MGDMLGNQIVQRVHILPGQWDLKICLMPFVFAFRGLLFAQIMQIDYFIMGKVLVFEGSDQLEPLFDILTENVFIFAEDLLHFWDLQDFILVTLEFGLRVIFIELAGCLLGVTLNRLLSISGVQGDRYCSNIVLFHCWNLIN